MYTLSGLGDFSQSENLFSFLEPRIMSDFKSALYSVDSTGFKYVAPTKYGPLVWSTAGMTSGQDNAPEYVNSTWFWYASSYYDQLKQFVLTTGKLPSRVINEKCWLALAIAAHRKIGMRAMTMLPEYFDDLSKIENPFAWIDKQKKDIKKYYEASKSLDWASFVVFGAALFGPIIMSQMGISASPLTATKSALDWGSLSSQGAASGGAVSTALKTAGGMVGPATKLISAGAAIVSATAGAGTTATPGVSSGYDPTVDIYGQPIKYGQSGDSGDLMKYLPYIALAGLAIMVAMK